MSCFNIKVGSNVLKDHSMTMYDNDLSRYIPNRLEDTLFRKPVTVMELLYIGKNFKGGTSCGKNGFSPNVVISIVNSRPCTQ